MDEKEREILVEIRERVTRIEANSSNIKERVQDLEDNQKWLWRTFVGAVIVIGVTQFFKWKGLA